MFAGFNGFQQLSCEDLKRSRDRIFEFRELKSNDVDVNDFIKSEQLLIACSWSYTAFALGQELLLKGFLTHAPNTVVKLRAVANIKQICVCDRHCLLVLDNGRLYKVQPRLNAKLEEIKLDDINPPTPTVPAAAQKRNIFGDFVQSTWEPFKITHIACGSNINVAFSNTKAVYSIPSKIHQFPKHFHIKQLLCGFEHALLLNSNGDVYSWGHGLRGQLGHDVLRIEEIPTLIEALAGIKITFIAASGWHSAAISAFGDLYTWGFNSNGQLALRIYKTSACDLKEPAVYPLPQLVELPNCCTAANDNATTTTNEDEDEASLCKPVKVFSGARHTILQMDCGTLYAAGWNEHGQLGCAKSKEFLDVFTKLPLASFGNRYLEIVCGPWCTVIKGLHE